MPAVPGKARFTKFVIVKMSVWQPCLWPAPFWRGNGWLTGTLLSLIWTRDIRVRFPKRRRSFLLHSNVPFLEANVVQGSCLTIFSDFFGNRTRLCMYKERPDFGQHWTRPRNCRGFDSVRFFFRSTEIRSFAIFYKTWWCKSIPARQRHQKSAYSTTTYRYQLSVAIL